MLTRLCAIHMATGRFYRKLVARQPVDGLSPDLENQHNAIYIYDYTIKKITQVTSGFYDCFNPVFDPEGKYLYFFTNQSFKPNYSDIDNTFIYPNTTQIAVIALKKETPSLLAPKNDTVALKTDEMAKDDQR